LKILREEGKKINLSLINRSLDILKNTSNDLLKNVTDLYYLLINSILKFPHNEPKNACLKKFNQIYCDYERGKFDAKTLKGKLKIVF
jgi:hypothetical protein